MNSPVTKFLASFLLASFLLTGLSPSAQATQSPGFCSQSISALGRTVRRGISRLKHYLKQRRQKQESNQQTGYPDGDSRYQAHNKDTDSPPHEGEFAEIISVNIPGLRYFAQVHYDDIDPETNDWRSHGRRLPLAASDRPAVGELTVRPGGGGSKYLMVPDGFTPLLPPDAGIKIHEDELGNFYIDSSHPEVRLALAERVPEPLSPEERARLTYVPPFRNAWPAWMQETIEHLKNLHRYGWSDTAVAEALAQAMQKNIKYRVDANATLGAVAMACDGKAQCDGSATIWSTVLRSELNIPTKVIGGRTGSFHPARPQESLVVAPGQGHAWGSVYDRKSHVWTTVDPTSGEKDRPTEDKGPQPNNPYKDISQASPNSEPKKKDQPTPVSGHPVPANAPIREMEEMDKELLAVFQAAWIHALEAAPDSQLLQKRLSNFQDLVATEMNANRAKHPFFSSYREQAAHLQNELGNLSQHFTDWKSILGTARYWSELPLAATQTIGVIQQVLRQLAEARPLHLSETKLLQLLNDFHSAGEASDSGIGQALVEAMPGPLAQSYLINRFGTLDGGFNYKQMGAEVRTGKHDGLLRILNIQSLLDFPEPPNEVEGEMDRTYYRLGRHISNRPVYVRATSPEDLPHIVRDANPTAVTMLNLLSGDLLRRQYQLPHKVVEPTVEQEPRDKSTWMILSDLSGSMAGYGNELIREALAMGMLDKIFAKAVSRQEDHQAFLLPYRDNPGTLLEAKSLPEATALFERLLKSPFISDGGNDTARAITAAMRKAQQSPQGQKEFNILVLTDGSETIRGSEIKSEREKINPEIKLGFNVVALVQGNSDLNNIAEGKAPIDLRGRYSYVDQTTVAGLTDTARTVERLKLRGAGFDRALAPTPIPGATAAALTEAANYLGQQAKVYWQQGIRRQAEAPSRLTQLPRLYSFAEGSERKRLLHLYLSVLSAVTQKKPETLASLPRDRMFDSVADWLEGR